MFAVSLNFNLCCLQTCHVNMLDLLSSFFYAKKCPNPEFQKQFCESRSVIKDREKKVCIDTNIPTTLLLVNFPVSKSISYLSFFFFYGIPTCKTPKAAPKNTHLLTKKKHVKNYVPLNLSRLQIFENFFYISEFLMYVCKHYNATTIFIWCNFPEIMCTCYHIIILQKKISNSLNTHVICKTNVRFTLKR